MIEKYYVFALSSKDRFAVCRAKDEQSAGEQLNILLNAGVRAKLVFSSHYAYEAFDWFSRNKLTQEGKKTFATLDGRVGYFGEEDLIG